MNGRANALAAARIVALCIVAAVGYGIAHDQVTARVCVEYFTIGHPRIVQTESPTVLGLVWGVVATWWVGLLLGLPLAFAALRGPRPPRTARSLVRPIAVLLVVMAASAIAAGLLGFVLAHTGTVFLLEPLATRVPHDRHAAFLVDLWAHSASYLVGFTGGLVLIRNVWRSRRRSPAADTHTATQGPAAVVGLPLDSPRWGELHDAYGSAAGIPRLLRELASLPAAEDHSEPWHSLWSALAHQGDVYPASFAAVPHVVDALATAPGSASHTYFCFPAWVEICRRRKNVQIPADLRPAYFEAIAMLPSLAAAAAVRDWSPDMLRSVLAAVAAVKGHPDVAEAALELQPETAAKFLEWHSSR